MKCSECLSYPLPFYATHINEPFLNSMISTNHDIVKGHSANGEIIIKGIETIVKTPLCIHPSRCHVIPKTKNRIVYKAI